MSQDAPAIDVERFEQSKDRRLLRFLSRIVGFFDHSGLSYAAFGSCAVFAHLGRMRRLVRDLDVILPPHPFERLAEVARAHALDAEHEREHFVRIKNDIFQVHAVPEVYRLFDYRTHELIAPIDTGVSWSELKTRPLVFASQPERLTLPVAPLETVLCICLLRPLNTNSIADVTALLGSPAFEVAGVERFLAHNPVLEPLIASQLDILRPLLDPLGAGDEVRAAMRRVRAVLA